MNSFRLADNIARNSVDLSSEFSFAIRTGVKTAFPHLRDGDIKIFATHFRLPDNLRATNSDWQKMGRTIAKQSRQLHPLAKFYDGSTQLFHRIK